MSKYVLSVSDVIYLAGPMRGYPLFNYPAFDAAAANLRQTGACVISPADLDRESGLDCANSSDPILPRTLRDCIDRDIQSILKRATAIAVLPGWQKSKGVAVEVSLARFLGLPVFDANTLELIEVQKQGTTPEDLTTKAVKYDTGKTRLELISPWVLESVGQVMTHGAQKYADHNWRKGFHWTRPIGASLRHTLAWMRGENLDRDSGLPHLAHAICCLMFTLEHQLLNMGVDDRWKKEETK